jgi:nickel/cobalt transporter (NicO) family protein
MRCTYRLPLLGALAVLVLIGGAAQAWAQFGPLGGLRPPPATGFSGWLLAQQAYFYRALAAMIRAAKADGRAPWGLMGVSFIYGIFHAAGPGHGKAVISSYLVANEETWRRGVVLSFASAALQSITAIAIVGVAAVLLGATAKLMGETVRVIEIVSYGLIVLLGARLLWVKGRGFFAALRKMKAPDVTADADPHHGDHGCASGHTRHDAYDHAHREAHDHAHHARDHAHHHAHDDDEEPEVLPCGHAHGPEPQDLAGPQGWRHGLAAIVSVGLRPCSGAIIVLVFALAQGLFWAGIASTFVMGLGTAITVAGAATLAVGARSLAKRLASKPAGYGSVLVRGLEFGAAGLVLTFGILLLTGYMATERMGLF